MSELAQSADVSLVLADYAVADAVGKVNVIGAGLTMLGFDPNRGISTRFTIWVSVRIPTRLCPAEFPVEVALLDAAGNLVGLPGPVEGTPQPLRIGQVVQVDKPNMPVAAAIRDHVGGHVQMVFDFSNGLPLALGGLYEWRVRLDGDDSQTWTYPFAVAAPPPGPVIG